jgi:hypothetical protein
VIGSQTLRSSLICERCQKWFSANLFALPFFLALFDRYHAVRVASLPGTSLGIPLLAVGYTSIHVAINCRGRRSGADTKNEDRGQQGERQTT